MAGVVINDEAAARRGEFNLLGAKPQVPIPKMDPDYMFRRRVLEIKREGEQYPLEERLEYRGRRNNTGQPPPKRPRFGVEGEGGRRKSRKSRKTRRRRHGRKTRRSRK